jgi:hypothetical protein
LRTTTGDQPINGAAVSEAVERVVLESRGVPCLQVLKGARVLPVPIVMPGQGKVQLNAIAIEQFRSFEQPLRADHMLFVDLSALQG